MVVPHQRLTLASSRLAALFRDPRPTNNLSDSMASLRSTASLSGGMRLEEAARAGDMDRVARIAVELLRLAQQGDAQGVLGAISAPAEGGRKDGRGGKQGGKLMFSANITTVHATASGMAIEQVSTGLKNVAPLDQPGRKDALRLLAMTEPMLDAATEASYEQMAFNVDTHVLKRTIIAVALQASRICAREPRLLEVADRPLPHPTGVPRP